MIKPFNIAPTSVIKGMRREIFCFEIKNEVNNIHEEVINSFGEEWKKFHQFTDEEMENYGRMYFDIVDENMLNKNSYAIDIGCGTGRWTKYLASRTGFTEAIDPSDAIIVADKFLTQANVRISKASIDNIPFDDETFDFAMCVGVLQFIPDTQKAMNDCVKKIKAGGFFYAYLYYNLENRNLVFKILFGISSVARKMISSFSTPIKKFVCDIIAAVAYMPFVLAGRFLKMTGFKKIADKMPLSTYQSETFFVIRNDALDRFGTSVEKRFSKAEVEAMMKNAGLENIIISDKIPYWHAVGKRVQ